MKFTDKAAESRYQRKGLEVSLGLSAAKRKAGHQEEEPGRLPGGRGVGTETLANEYTSSVST